MILVDANLLLYAHVADMPQHVPAQRWLDQQVNGATPVGLPWPSLLSFVRVATNPRIFRQPIGVRDAWQQVDDWLDCPVVWIPCPTERHRTILAGLVRNEVSRADLIPDAHLAALAIEHGLTLCSADGDFARFSGLRWENPLATRA